MRTEWEVAVALREAEAGGAPAALPCTFRNTHILHLL